MPDKFPLHGGSLYQAESIFGVPTAGWQDLSTGISPWAYPVSDLPLSVWQRLPDDNHELLRAAADYYRVADSQLLALPGSQYAIARLPRYLAPARVALPVIGYFEHQKAWLAAGHSVVFYRDQAALMTLVENGAVEHAVVINPNNPTGELMDVPLMRQMACQLQGKGLLLVDEAFMDLRPEHSATGLLATCSNLWILRSLGKFFGLAGLRLGFLLGNQQERAAQQLAEDMGPWAISHPAQWVGTQALHDRAWQQQQRARINAASHALAAMIRKQTGPKIEVVDAGLFITLIGDHRYLHNLYQAFGGQGIYTRWCHLPPTEGAHNSWLRIGLPDDGGARLTQLLATINQDAIYEC